ncbi:hypothetical protein RJ639_027359 [Escallonia herrerae]|uniref:Uncharacterized protein n=1 Tax=Escallonia herrerae TaxID=1293975 RepID=A0AA88X2L3_9ASTE|nr:hypothetical protein RJ639_027359 [Escallonia herrerae]
MGNCGFKGFREMDQMIRVVTSTGGVMELYAPITAERITSEFPGHALFSSPDQSSPPLLHNEGLRGGASYYLLPFNTGASSQVSETTAAPYRVSSGNAKRAEAAEVFPRYNSSGVWKVRLVISPEQLSDILSHEGRTEALIESVRTVAKCGCGGSVTASSAAASSDQCSLSSVQQDSWSSNIRMPTSKTNPESGPINPNA